jgi:FtsZ-binding cell division protein ZapB
LATTIDSLRQSHLDSATRVGTREQQLVAAAARVEQLEWQLDAVYDEVEWTRDQLAVADAVAGDSEDMLPIADAIGAREQRDHYEAAAEATRLRLRVDELDRLERFAIRDVVDAVEERRDLRRELESLRREYTNLQSRIGVDDGKQRVDLCVAPS